METVKAYSAASAKSPFGPSTIARRDPTDHDVQIEILFCGICHSDLHYVRNEWSDAMPTIYPCVPGHEIVGRVPKVGSAVSKFKPGDLAAVGCLVDTDRTCPQCQAGLEQFCHHMVLTYGSPDKHTGGVLTVATPTASPSMSTSCCMFPPTSTWLPLRPCSAPGSQPTLHCATGV